MITKWSLRSFTAACVATLTAGLFVATAAAPAQAATIDRYAPLSRAGCPSVSRPGTIALGNFLETQYAGTNADTSVRKPCSSTPYMSDHSRGLAIDWSGAPAGSSKGEQFLRWLFAPDASGNAHAKLRELGISQIIWNHHKWTASVDQDVTSSDIADWPGYDASGCWAKYSSADCDHVRHMHISLGDAGGSKSTSWWTTPSVRDEGPASYGGGATGGGSGSIFASFYGMTGTSMDFDGDGKTDVFSRASDGRWRYVSAGVGSWTDMSSSSIPLDDLRFGDFDGDGKTDVFSVVDEDDVLRWRYASGGKGTWINLSRSGVALEDLRFGDFNGDGKTDVFSRESDGRWRYVSGGVGTWIDLSSSGIPLADLRFGDFNGDGKTDVFSVADEDGSLRWRYASGGKGSWIDLSRSAVPLDQLRFGDFNGDGKTDVFNRASDGGWRYVSAAVGSWIALSSSAKPLDELRFGDFNGDRKTDVFSTSPEEDALRWRYAAGGKGTWIDLSRSAVALVELRVL